MSSLWVLVTIMCLAVSKRCSVSATPWSALTPFMFMVKCRAKALPARGVSHAEVNTGPESPVGFSSAFSWLSPYCDL